MRIMQLKILLPRARDGAPWNLYVFLYTLQSKRIKSDCLIKLINQNKSRHLRVARTAIQTGYRNKS